MNTLFVEYPKTYFCGYGPRSIQLSVNSDAVFVGCKDGSVHVVDRLLYGDVQRSFRLYDDRPHAVHSLCDLGSRRLLVGREGSEIAVWGWEGNHGAHKNVKTPLSQGGAVSLIEWLNTQQLIVSVRGQGTWILNAPEKEWDLKTVADSLWKQAKHIESIGNSGLICAIPVISPRNKDRLLNEDSRLKEPPHQWLMVSESGTIWLMRHQQDQLTITRQEIWAENPMGCPAFVTDFAFIKPPDNPDRYEQGWDTCPEVAYGVYIATDIGINLLTLDSDSKHIISTPVTPKGIVGMPMAITYYAEPREIMRRYLWVADSSGDTHLFESKSPAPSYETQGQIELDQWQRAAVHGLKSHVMRAFLLWRRRSKENQTLIVVQACRNDRIVVSDFIPTYQKTDPLSLLNVLRFGGVTSLVDDDLPPNQFPEARVAALIEKIAANSPQELADFLRLPRPDLANEILSTLPEENRGSALELWTHALLGAVHRGERVESEAAFLGIIRWLALINHQYASAQDIQRCILYVRRWGLFGHSYHDRSNAISPLQQILKEQEKLTPRRSQDFLAYGSLLMQRRYDIELVSKRSKQIPHPNQTAWDLRALTAGNTLWLATSWIQHLELQCIRLTNESSQRPWKMGEPWSRYITNDRQYSRNILLSKLPNKEETPFLLAAPDDNPVDSESKLGAALELFLLQTHREELEPQVNLVAHEVLEGQRIYSLIELKPGLIMVGLRGEDGKAGFATVRLSIDNIEIEGLQTEILTPAYPETKNAARNPIWALANLSSGEECMAVAGCGDGQVWLIKDPESENVGLVRVGRAHTPIWAIAARKLETGRIRVYAGGADGTLIVWQEVNDGNFIPLWATQEQKPISRIHLLQKLDAEDPVVVAITQGGLVSIFQDLDTLSLDASHTHQPVPGKRMDRIQLPTTCFASAPIPIEFADSAKEFEPLFRLLTAGDDGQVAIVGFHYPQKTQIRRVRYQELESRWLKLVSDEDGLIDPHYMRLAESSGLAAPTLPHVMLRWLLQPETSLPQDLHPWLPHHLQPLYAVGQSWRAQRGSCVEEVREALRRIRRLNDYALFLDAVYALLRMANHHIKIALEKSVPITELVKLFKELLEGLHHSSNLWLGGPGDTHLRAQMLQASDLLDGDLLFQLNQRLIESEDLQLKELLNLRVNHVRNLLHRGDPILDLKVIGAVNVSMIRACGHLTRYHRETSTRIELPWKSLRTFYEALGALSARSAHAGQGLHDALAHRIAKAWALAVCACPSHAVEIAHLLTETDTGPLLLGRAAQQFRLLSDLGLEVSHDAQVLFEVTGEINRFRDEGLSESFSVRNKHLCELLYNEPIHWRDENGRDRLELPPMSADKPNRSGIHNARRADSWWPIDLLLRWLHQLADDLEDDAAGVDFAALTTIKHILSGPGTWQKIWGPHPFRHSLEYWETVFASKTGKSLLNLASEESSSADETPARHLVVAPTTVLAATTVLEWTVEAIEELKRREEAHNIFDPQRRIYRHALERVRSSAARFAYSSAVQRDLVLGVLGHGLMEALDEQALEFWEAAQALDALLVWGYSESPREPSEATRFARYLLRLAWNADGVPRVLRTLHDLLFYARRSTGQSESSNEEKKSLFSKPHPTAPRWRCPEDNISTLTFSRLELHMLGLALKELASNDNLHSAMDNRDLLDGNSSRKNEREPGLNPEVTIENSQSFKIQFFVSKSSEEDLLRLEIASRGIRVPTTPHPTREVLSHGTGLYLAALAASMAGWKMEITRPTQLKVRNDWCSFFCKFKMVRGYGT